jgi:hypothetical protein
MTNNKENDQVGLIDKGDCYFDSDMKPTITYDENGNMLTWIYCPYIPKFLFDDNATEIEKTE